MHSLEKNNLVLLRQRIPIGFLHGRMLLEKTNGDVDQAEKLFRREAIATVSQKTGVNHAVAEKHLEEYHFDIPRALNKIDEARFTLTERILTRYQDKLEALERIADATVVELKIEGEGWLSFDDLAKHPTEIFCTLSVVEWLHYCDYEGFDYALHFHLDVIVDQVEQQLHLPEVAAHLRSFPDHFGHHRHILIDTLYDYVVNNVTQFP